MSDFTGVIGSMASGGDSAPSDSAVSPAATETPSSDASASVASPAASTPETSASQSVASPTEGQAVPYLRFKEVNEERSRFKESLDKLAWASQIPETDAPTVAEFYTRLRQDPMGTLIGELEAAATSDPSYAQAIRSAAAKWLSAGRAQAKADAMPEPDLETGDGRLLYSDAQQRKLLEWNERRVLARMHQTLQPIQQHMQRVQADTLRSQIQTQAQDWAVKTYETWKARPHFESHKAEIGKLMADKGIGVADAYAEILTTKVLPSLSAQERSSVVAAMHQKAEAGSVNPARTPAQGLKRPSSFKEAMAQLSGG